jgi:hypothetical protein
MNIELRWVERDGPVVGNRLDHVPYRERVLQYRQWVEGREGLSLSDWTDVPVVKEGR